MQSMGSSQKQRDKEAPIFLSFSCLGSDFFLGAEALQIDLLHRGERFLLILTVLLMCLFDGGRVGDGARVVQQLPPLIMYSFRRTVAQ